MRLPEVPTKDEVGHLTKTFNRMIERLESSFIQIRQFTSDASHELRTPLTILQGELELALHSEKTTEEYEVVLLSALEEVGRLTNVVETLLNLSRADSGQIKMNFASVNLSKMVQDIAEDASILSEIKGVDVKCDIEANLYIEADQPRLHQAVLNIVDNAIKYTPEGGKISIELKNGGSFANIIVSDTGMGIPAEQLPRIFDRFYRVDKARASTIQGSGLGLSIVKWIVDAHNGKINVQSKLHEGTTFTLNMPVMNND
jgi:heavy metal sensor kinase